MFFVVEYLISQVIIINKPPINKKFVIILQLNCHYLIYNFLFIYFDTKGNYNVINDLEKMYHTIIQ
jgi:hypothetical protein